MRARSIRSGLRRAEFVLTAAGVLAVALASADVLAQSRRVVVNGMPLNDAQVAGLQRRHCIEIADGAYWFDAPTGAWGYAGNPQVQGVLGAGCRHAGERTAAGGSATRFGPYATMRRAQEVADQMRGQGWRTVAFHNGDGYYVDARR